MRKVFATSILKTQPRVFAAKRPFATFSTTANKMSNNFTINSKYTLNSGHQIPILGYGVYQTSADVAESVTLHALKTGYRHIDSARAYRNEKPCAEAMRASGLKREDLFFTSKVPPKSMGYENAKQEIESTFAETGLDYVDLYLIHAPYGGKEGRLGAWKALVEAQKVRPPSKATAMLI